jgi:ribonucleoside-diphosphate reductase subunit M1
MLDPMSTELKVMYVVNRTGEREPIAFDKILSRIEKLSFGLHSLVDPATVAKNVINGVSLV